MIGAGSWATTVAALATRHATVKLWARRPEVAEEINERHTSSSYVGDHRLPVDMRATTSMAQCLAGADVVVIGVPSHSVRQVVARAAPQLPVGVPILSLAKGLEQHTQLRMTEVVHELAPGHPVGVLTGPNFAGEILAGFPAAAVIAVEDHAIGADLQRLFSTEAFRVYTNDDVVGCEVAGALKNVVAIAAGMSDGLGFGDNTRAALITRGLAELTRLGVALGGRSPTFSGLAGLGDLVATCTSGQSRNRQLGEQLGRGRTLEEIMAGTNTVTEGVRTAAVVVELAARHGVDVPIAAQVAAVIEQGKPARDVIPALMARVVRRELHDIA